MNFLRESTSFVIDVLPNYRNVEHSQENNVRVYSVLNWSYAVRHYTSPGSAKHALHHPVDLQHFKMENLSCFSLEGKRSDINLVLAS